MIEAAFVALDVGRPLNRWITINWALGGLHGCEGPQATVAFLKRYRDWMRHHGERASWVYSHETGSFYGIHVHLLLHVPERLNEEFRRCPRRWSKAGSKKGYVAKTVRTRKIAIQQKCDDINEQVYILWLKSKLHYMLKAASKRTEADLDVREWSRVNWGSESDVRGKRYGWWQRWDKGAQGT